ncbi:MAG: phage tail tape measure protein [Paenibacillaceae bacterium]|nr:phage tail tape measure protein [Paenibacillaceae bacterium]
MYAELTGNCKKQRIKSLCGNTLGWKTEDMLKGLPGVMTLAAAFGEDLGSVSGTVTDTMEAFGLQANHSARMIDVLAQASISTNTSLDMMGKALQGAAPAASAFGYSIEDTAMAVGLMSDAGIQGEAAGQSLKSLLTHLSEPTKLVQNYMDRLSVSLKDSSGEMKPLGTMLSDLKSGFSGLSNAQKEEYASGLAGKDGMAGFLAMMEGSDEEFIRLKDAMENSEGAAKKLSDVRMDNLAGDVSLFSSVYDGIGLDVYSNISDDLRMIVQGATKWLQSFGETLEINIPTARRFMSEFADGLVKTFGPVKAVGEWFLNHPEAINGGITGITAAFATFKAANIGISVLGKLSSLITAWPLAAFGLAAGAIAGVFMAVKAHNDKLARQDLEQRFGSIKLSVEELDATAKKIVDNGNLNNLSKAFGELDKVKDLSRNFKNNNDNLDKLIWKVGMGFELDESDKNTFASSVDGLVKGALDIVEQTQYSANLNIQALFGSDSNIGNQLIDSFNATYQSIGSQVNDIGKKLGEVYKDAIVDGVIDSKEAEMIRSLQSELSNVTSQVIKSRFEGKMQRIMMQYSGKDLDPDTFNNLQQEIKDTLAEEREQLMQVMDLSLGDLELQLNRGDISVQEYDDRKKIIKDQYHNQEMEYQANGVSFSVSTIADAYQDVFKDIIPEVRTGLDDVMLDIRNAQNANVFSPNFLWEQMGFDKIDNDEMDSLQSNWKAMKSDYAQLQAEFNGYLERGETVPESVAKKLSDASFIGAAAGDKHALWQMIGINAAGNSDYMAAIEKARNADIEIPEEIALYIDKGGPVVTNAVERLYDLAETTANDKTADIVVKGNVRCLFNYPNDEPQLIAFKGKQGYELPPLNKTEAEVAPNVKRYAKGGLISHPTISWFAEEYPEMAIPINNSKRSRMLWQETGRLIGAYEENNYGKIFESMTSFNSSDMNGGNSFAPVFSPTIYINGKNATREETQGAVQMTYEQFKEWAAQLQREKIRVAF